MNAAARAWEARRPARGPTHGRAGAAPGRGGCAVDLAARAAELAGLDLRAVGEAAMLAALDKAASVLGLDAARYLDLAAREPARRRVLAGEAVVQESWLFREPETFAALKNLALTLPRPIRALCVPCAGGEEPVSMALTFLDAGLDPGEFHIDAADVSESALAAARAGVFGPRSVRGDIGRALGRFTCSGQDLVLDPKVAQSIRYLAGDVLNEDFLAQEPPYQVIFCRHLLIYLNTAGRERLAATLSRLLAQSGLLFAASAEAAALLGLGFSLCGGQNGAPVLTPGLTPGLTQGPAQAVPGGSVSRAPGGLPGARPSTCPAAGAAEEARAQPDGVPAAAPAARLLDEAQALAGAGHLDEALAILNRALGESEPSPALYALKGAALLALGRPDEAEAAFRRSLYLDPCHVEALGHLELLARAGGRAGEASRLAARLMRAQASGERP